MIIKNITEFIGETPLLLIDPKVHGLKNIELYAKLELFNPFGSLKDRTAMGLIEKDLPLLIKEEKTIIESSSGNTAKALAVLASINGLNFKTITNRIKIPEIKQILQLLGADVKETPGMSECPDPNDENNPLNEIDKLMTLEPGSYYHNSQYFSEVNPQKHFDTTGLEIARDLGKVDYLVASVGTSGSSKGAAKQLIKNNKNLKKIGVIAEKGDFIPGIRNSDELKEVGIFDPSYYDYLEVVSSAESIESMLILNRSVGVLAGPTSGATLFGALKYLKEEDKKCKTKKKAVFIVCDRVEWYMSYIQKRRPDIFNLESNTKDFNVNQEDANSVELIKAVDLKKIKDNNYFIVDIRGSMGFSMGHIPGSINISESELESMLQYGIPFSKGSKIIFVCSMGEKSKKFAAILNKNKFIASSLEGGIIGWKREGLKLDKTL